MLAMLASMASFAVATLSAVMAQGKTNIPMLSDKDTRSLFSEPMMNVHIANAMTGEDLDKVICSWSPGNMYYATDNGVFTAALDNAPGIHNITFNSSNL